MVQYFLVAPKSHYLLTNTWIACQDIGIFFNRQFRRICVTDLKDTTPLCKVCPVLFILSTALRQAIESCRRRNSHWCTQICIHPISYELISYTQQCIQWRWIQVPRSHPELWFPHSSLEGAQPPCQPGGEKGVSWAQNATNSNTFSFVFLRLSFVCLIVSFWHWTRNI